MAESVAVDAAAQISKRHHGWYVWREKPIATRKVHPLAEAIKPTADDNIFALTVIGDTWRDLDAQLVEQDKNDAQRYEGAVATAAAAQC